MLVPVGELLGGDAADGCVEEFDHVEGGEFFLAGSAETAAELHEAAGVGGDDGVGVGGEEMGDFAIAELLGGFGLEEIVDAGGAAAEGGFGDFGDLEAGDSGEQLARLLIDALRVAEMAGVVVGDADREWIARGWRMTFKGFEFREDFGDVAAFCGEGAGARGPVGIVAEEMAVLLHGGTAAGGVDDDGFDLGLLKERDDAAGHFGGLVFEAGVDHECSAAGLICGGDDFTAFGGQDSGGCGVDVREEDLLNAAGEHAYAAARSGGGSGARWLLACEVRGDHGKKRFHCGEAFGGEFEQAGAADEGLQAGALVEEERCGEGAETRGIGEGCEEDAAEERVGGGAGDVSLDLRAGVFDELVVLDAGGAGRHAGHAAEAVVHVAAEGLIEGRVALGGGLHHVDAAAGRVHLLAPEDVGGAGGKTKAAVDAVGEEGLRGRVVRVEGTGLGRFDGGEMRHG